MSVTKNEHNKAFKKLGLRSIEHRYSCTWDRSYNTFANVYELAPDGKVRMQDLEAYLDEQEYDYVSKNTAMWYAPDGTRRTFRCYFWRRAKYDFLIIMTRQRTGKKEYVTRAEHHYKKAPRDTSLIEGPLVEAVMDNKPKRKRLEDVLPKKKSKPKKSKKPSTRRRLNR